MKSIARFALAIVSATLVIQSGSAAHAERLTDNESQFIRFISKLDFEKANFYLSQGLVDPYNLSTGKPLPYYLYGPGTISYTPCRIPSYYEGSSGDCTPDITVTEYLLSGDFDLNAELEDGRRPMSYVCWGSSLGFRTTAKLVQDLNYEVDFYDDHGFTPLHHCAWRGASRQRDEAQKKYLNILATLVLAGTDVDKPLKIARTIAPNREIPIHPGATPLMLALSAWGGDNEEMEAIDLLFALGANPAATDDMGAGLMSYVRYPSANRHYEPTAELLKLLHKNGVDILQPRGKEGKTFVETAMAKGDVDFAMQVMEIADS